MGEGDTTDGQDVKETAWGRVLICGGTNWATNGRKDRTAASPDDLLEPRILRSLSNIRVTKILSGPTANYALALDIHGAAYLFGKAPTNSLGVISESAPVKITPASVGQTAPGAQFVTGSTGRGHVILVDDQGSAWGCGSNIVGQLGLPITQEVDKFTRITGPWMRDPGAKIVQVSTGNTFSLFLSDSGQVYAAGSSEAGQLGNGKTGERLLKAGKVAFDIESPPRLVQGLSEKKIVQIASGNQHSLAMDEEGYVYAWGFAGYSRLGLQDQKERLVPTLVPQFAGHNRRTRAQEILCGPTSSVVIDPQGVFYIAGKFRLTGDGGVGQPYTSFKPIQDIMSCRILRASLGGCTHFVTTPADTEGNVMTVGFGQGCLYGELGLGSEGGKSASKPVQIMPLAGVDVIDIAAGAFFTLFLARPNSQLSELERFPKIPSPNLCVVCNADKPDVEDPIECEKCEIPYHLGCLDPPLDAIPEGEWFCQNCEAEQEAGLEVELRPVADLHKKPKSKDGKRGLTAEVNGREGSIASTPGKLDDDGSIGFKSASRRETSVESRASKRSKR